MAEAKMTLSLVGGEQHEVWADEVKLRKLKLALTRRMARGEREAVDVRGKTYVAGAEHPVDLTIMTDQLAGVSVVGAAEGARADGR